MPALLCHAGGESGGSGPIAPTTSIDVASANDLNKTGHSTHSRGESLAEDDAMCVVCLDKPASAGFVHGDRCGPAVLLLDGLRTAVLLGDACTGWVAACSACRC